MIRRLAFVLVILALSGFSFYTGTERVTQPTTIGNAHFEVTFCATGASAGSSAATTAGGTVTEPGDPCGQTSALNIGKGQGLIALRVPAGLPLPETLTLASGVTATKSPDYTTTVGTPPAGMQIQGYITSVLNLTSKTDYTTSFDLPLPAVHPFVGPLKARILAGWRPLGLLEDGTGAFSCSTTCVTSVSPATDFSFPTRDLGVATPAPGTLAFPLNYNGPAGPTFALTASTTVPQGSAVPTQAIFTPTDNQQTTETVTVTVPVGTTPGTYDVTLTAKLESQTRTATGTITVATPTGPSGPAGPTAPTGPKVTPTPTPKPVATVTATPYVVPPTTQPKRAPKKLTLKLKKTRSLAFKARGKLTLPKGVIRADGCAGVVRFTVGKVKKSTVLTGSCTFSRTLKVKKAGSYKVTARFTGNQALKAKAAKAKRFRAG